MLKPRYRAQRISLNILRQARGEALHIHFIGRISLRLDKKLVPVLIAEAHQFILYRRAIPRGRSVDFSAVHRRAVEI